MGRHFLCAECQTKHTEIAVFLFLFVASNLDGFVQIMIQDVVICSVVNRYNFGLQGLQSPDSPVLLSRKKGYDTMQINGLPVSVKAVRWFL